MSNQFNVGDVVDVLSWASGGRPTSTSNKKYDLPYRTKIIELHPNDIFVFVDIGAHRWALLAADVRLSKEKEVVVEQPIVNDEYAGAMEALRNNAQFVIKGQRKPRKKKVATK